MVPKLNFNRRNVMSGTDTFINYHPSEMNKEQLMEWIQQEEASIEHDELELVNRKLELAKWKGEGSGG